jgi:hypothetical protein
MESKLSTLMTRQPHASWDRVTSLGTNMLTMINTYHVPRLVSRIGQSLISLPVLTAVHASAITVTFNIGSLEEA